MSESVTSHRNFTGNDKRYTKGYRALLHFLTDVFYKTCLYKKQNLRALDLRVWRVSVRIGLSDISESIKQ